MGSHGIWDRRTRDVLGSPDGAMPGTIVEGEKAACSISAK